MPINYTSGVKKPGLSTNYTPEQVKEIIRCGQDPLYFAEKYYHIVHPTRGKMLIKLYDYQKELINTFKGNQKTVVLAARQVGKTTCSALFLLWYALFNDDKMVAILANKQKTAKSIVDEIKIAYENLPMWMKPGVTEYNNLTIRFENGTEIQAAATSADALRGESVSLLFLDEFAFIPENMAEDFWRSNYPTLSTGGNVIIVSTPNGAAGKFYDIYTKAENKQNDFTPIKVAWDAHPDRDEEWKQATIKEFGLQAFLQEYQLSFTGSTQTLIGGEILTSLVYQEPPENGILEGGKYKIWIPARKNHIYAIGTDTGQGVGGDYSVINIFDITTYRITGRVEQVAVWADNQTRVFDFAEIILRVAKEWNDPYIIVEANQNFGAIVTKLLYFENGYENMFYDTVKGEFGVFASGTTKSLALTHFKDQVESGTMILKSEEMIKELSYFEEVKDGIFKARKGTNFHDDYITSAYWVSYMLKDKWFEDAYDTMRVERGITTISDKSQQELTDEGTLDLFMSSFGSGENFEQSMFDREMWLDEPAETTSPLQLQLDHARREHYQRHRQDASVQKRRLDRHN